MRCAPKCRPTGVSKTPAGDNILSELRHKIVIEQLGRVSFDATANTVNITAHGLSNNQRLFFRSITGTTTLTNNVHYFIVNATANAFQVAAIEGGAAINIDVIGFAQMFITDGIGGFKQVWAQFAQGWSRIMPRLGNERFFGQRVEENITHLITMRYISGVTAEMRISFDGRIFQIKSEISPLENKEYLELLCIEGVGS